jgi:hypothetical protein
MCKTMREAVRKDAGCRMPLTWLGNLISIALAVNAAACMAAPNGYLLDLASPQAVKTVGPDVSAPREIKFVQVEVDQVSNPGQTPLSFHLDYQPKEGEKSFLGTFSLFPPDNPGTFIVATRGELRSGGTVIVTLVPLEPVNKKEEIRVHLKHISFIRRPAQ